MPSVSWMVSVMVLCIRSTWPGEISDLFEMGSDLRRPPHLLLRHHGVGHPVRGDHVDPQPVARPVLHLPHLQYSTVQYSTVQYSTVQYSTPPPPACQPPLPPGLQTSAPTSPAARTAWTVPWQQHVTIVQACYQYHSCIDISHCT